MEAKYNHIGKGYNTTRRADPYLLERLHYHLNPINEGLYLDIGCGTGNYTSQLHDEEIRFIGIDPSEKMLDKAKKTVPQIEWKLGKAENIPLENNSMEGVVGTLTLHHWDNLEKGFSELFRVMKPYTNVVFFTATPKQMKGYWLNHYFPKMLADSMQQMPSMEKITNAMNAAGFNDIFIEKYNIQPNLKDQFLYAGKQNPSLYLDENVRNGISSFSHLAHQDEVQKGLTQLEKDIASGEINTIMKTYENKDGDYLFLLSQKEG
ncbi:class I SAM-dependent methyltransferase [Kordia sp. YSTF-M3]|uniref:Class I SAM-dependent methyltransferase n=1 Tax=Kordia aestuariivivens TaxID=2759037 RepID=A0ABR7QFE4_9FLAO|nr:class I SAM-dependent methyltransferase [Kordia aestuariivivens]MBC8757228.1 class I SAM-dependent methyltransferase [Kordia aestuariivivens]